MTSSYLAYELKIRFSTRINIITIKIPLLPTEEVISTPIVRKAAHKFQFSLCYPMYTVDGKQGRVASIFATTINMTISLNK